jgi:hypothetical protein
VRGGCRAVDRDLHAVDAQRGEAVRGRVVDAAAVGLELERDAAAGQAVEEVPAERNTQRLAAAERDVGNGELDDRVRERERLVARQLVRPRAIGPGLLAARDAARRAAVGELPGDEERRAIFVDRAPGDRPEQRDLR